MIKRMTKMRDWMKLIVWNAEGAGGGAADPAPGAAPPADAGSILFPNDKPADPAAGGDPKPADPAAGDKPADPPAGDWKEYVPDPAKSDEENAAAKAEHDKTKPAPAEADKVPDDGKYALKMPDGVELDAELADALGPEFKELGLTNAQAQKLVDKYIGIQQARAGKQSETFAATVSGWAETAKKDPEMGGDKWDGTVQAATRAVNRLGTPALKEYLNASGGGNHSELIRILAKAGAMIAEDNPASGGAEGKGKPAEAAYTLFPTDAPKG
jgi:hypothetical protein